MSSAVHDRDGNSTGSGFLTRDPYRSDGFWPGDPTRPDPTRSLSVVKQILNNGLTTVSVRLPVTVRKPKPFSAL